MSREIKFRAWDIAQKAMLPVEQFSDIYVTVSPPDNDDEGNHSYELEHALFDDGSGEIEAHVMQFTGLHDCKGREIYESDVVRYKIGDEHSIARVEFIAGAFRLATDRGSHSFAARSHLEVLGNTHQHPELMEVEK